LYYSHCVLSAVHIPTYKISALIQFSSAFSPRHNLTFGFRAFRFSAPRICNSLPVSIHESRSLPTFRRHLKTFYFQSAYSPFSCPPCLEYLCPRALILLRLWRYISHILTYLYITFGNASLRLGARL